MANVVSLNEYDKSRKNRPADSATALAECRDIALEKLTHSVASMMDKLEDELFDLANKSKSRDEQNLYLETRGLAQKQRAVVEAQFKKIFTDTFNKKISGEKTNTSEYGKLESTNIDLKLVDYDDLEEKVAVTNMATKLKSNCNDELSALEQRIAYLLGESNLKAEDNPVSPEAICTAFKNACHELESSVKIKLVILKMFDKFVGEDVHEVYQNINARLVQRQILPKIRHGSIKKQPSVDPTPVRQPALPTENPNRSFDPSISSESGKPHLPAEQDLFSTLQNLMALNYAQSAGPPTKGIQPSTTTNNASHLENIDATPFPTLNIDASESSEDVHGKIINSLNKLQHGEMDSSIPEILKNAMHAEHVLNIVKDIKTLGIITHADKIDAVTIDIVAMLFDCIFEDNNISDAVKVLIGKLQIPVLKVAILDKTFFSESSHPTRELLNTLATSSVDWGNDVDKNNRLYKKINDIIQTIQKEFNENNLEIFSLVLKDLQQFLTEEAEQADAVAERSAKIIEDIERLEIAKIKAQDEIKKRIECKDIPKSVYDFISNHWENVLFDAFVEHGGESETWTQSIITLENLIWSVLPMKTAEDRKKLVALLPKLLKEVQEGMRLSSMSSAERDQFFTELVNCHAAAVKSGLRFNDQAMASVENKKSTDLSKQAHETKPPIKENTTGEFIFVPPSAQKDDRFADLAINMEKGTWMEFQKNGSYVRAKLTWVSPLRGLYLFTTREGAKAATLPLDELINALRTGTARIIKTDTPLFDRAVSSLIGGLKKSSPR